jgi:hypothetical protein
MKLDVLSLQESKRLIELESIIKSGKQTFVDVGIALAEVRDGKLYKADHSTFEDYCQSKWGWTKQHAYRLIECAPIAKSNTRVTSIRQAQEAAKVPEEKREEVVSKAAEAAKAEDRPMTAADIKTQAASLDHKWKSALGGNITLPAEPAAHSPEDDYSETLRALLFYWRKANKSDRAKFCEAAEIKQSKP